MPRALTVDDATVLKLTLFALLERYSTFDRSDLDEMNEMMPTPRGPANEIMDAINRVRVDGKAVIRTERTIDKAKLFYELHYPFAETDFPGGLSGGKPAHAITGRHAAARRRARRTHRAGRRPGDHRAARRVHRDPQAARTGTLTSPPIENTRRAVTHNHHAPSGPDAQQDMQSAGT